MTKDTGMPLMEWNSTLQLGVEPFDEHHKHLFSLFNRTYDLIATGAPADCFNEVYKELKDYTVYHFGAEELWMHERDYPQKQTHIQQHETFFKEIVRFEDESAEGGVLVSIGVLTFIKEWLLNHIYKIDAEYAAHILSKGIS
jgi:hemerythrin